MAKIISQEDIEEMLDEIEEGITNTFIEQGFETPKWRGNIDKCNSNNLFGTIIDKDVGTLNAIFLKDGSCYIIGETDIYPSSVHNLVPLEKPWYKNCNFPILVINKNTKEIGKATDAVSTTLIIDGYRGRVKDYRPANIGDLSEMIYGG